MGEILDFRGRSVPKKVTIEITPEMRIIMLKQGVSFICVHCDHFWWSFQHGFGKCRAGIMHLSCGGPLGGLAFPEYKGPIHDLTQFCFVCGKEADAAVEVRPNDELGSKGGIVGVCKMHIDMLKTYSKPGEPPPFVVEDNATVLKV